MRPRVCRKRVGVKWLSASCRTKYRACQMAHTSYGLQRSGIATLKSNAEINELCRLVVSHGEAHPLGSDRDTVFQGVDLLKLLTYSAEKRVNLVGTRIQDVIRDSGAKITTN